MTGNVDQGDALVSVIVPAWNAAATIDATLRSIRAQTHRPLEIIVVDDGSTDATAAIAEQHAAVDVRVRVLRQENAGVAAARNLGIAASHGAFVAPVDADDLWAATKIERQIARFAQGDDRIGLVYCGYAVIDADDRILRTVLPMTEGDVRAAIVEANFVGNGSGALFRRAALDGCGGYDATLRARGAQGCEDHMIYFRVALDWAFGVVPEALLGYRLLPGAMSRDPARMLRSHEMCLAEFAAAWPDGAAAIARGRRVYRRWMLERVVAFGPWSALPGCLAQVARDSLVEAARGLATGLVRWSRGWLADPRRRAVFAIGAPVDAGVER